MKINKIYKLIFGEIIKPTGYSKKFDIGNDYVFITPDSYYGFVLCKKEIPFNLEMIKNASGNIDLSSAVKPKNLLRKTNYFVKLPQGLISVFNNDNRKVYINSKFLSYFEEYTEFYQEKDLSICVAVENGQVVGAICPIRHNEEREGND